MLHALDLVHDGLLELPRGPPRQRRAREPEEIGVVGEIGVVSSHVERHPLLVDEPPVQPRGAPLLQDGGEQLERGGVRGGVVGHMEADVDDRDARVRFVHLDATLAQLRRLDRVHRWRRGAAGDLAEGLSRAGEHSARVHVPCHDEEGVVGEIVAIVEGTKLARIDALDIAHPADHRPAVGMRLVGRGEEFLREVTVGVVLGARPALFRHHLSLRIDLLRIEQQLPHPVGLDAED